MNSVTIRISTAKAKEAATPTSNNHAGTGNIMMQISVTNNVAKKIVLRDSLLETGILFFGLSQTFTRTEHFGVFLV